MTTISAQQLRDLQTPIKERYRADPASATITLSASGELDSAEIACNVDTGRALVQAGLHPATGGDGTFACSGDMLLEALVACAGVTLRAVATALGITVHRGVVHAEGDLPPTFDPCEFWLHGLPCWKVCTCSNWQLHTHLAGASQSTQKPM